MSVIQVIGTPPPPILLPTFLLLVVLRHVFLYLSVSHSWSIIYETDAQSSRFTQKTECE